MHKIATGVYDLRAQHVSALIGHLQRQPVIKETLQILHKTF
jgi:hypothetical protein